MKSHTEFRARFEALYLLQAKDTILGPSGLSYLELFSGLNWNFLLDDSAECRGLPLAAGAGAVEGLCPGLGRDPGVFFWEAAL